MKATIEEALDLLKKWHEIKEKQMTPGFKMAEGSPDAIKTLPKLYESLKEQLQGIEVEIPFGCNLIE